MRFVSWNVNGLRAVLKKGFEDIFATFDADVFALQETKLQAGQVDLDLPGYHDYWSYAERKGYSGTAVFSKREPLQVLHGLGDDYLDAEGRICALEFPELWFVDTWRTLHPDTAGVYSWWSYRFNARKNNAGWRIDYFLVSEALRDKMQSAEIHGEVFGSDHCPVALELDL